MLRICISGLTASGKTILGTELAKSLNIMHITKELAENYHRFESDKKLLAGPAAVIETANKRYAKGFDAEIAKLAQMNNCVVTTWLGPWIVKHPTLRIWLDASFDVRVRRTAMRIGMPKRKAARYVRLKDRKTIDSFKSIYHIDVMDHSIFDIELNTEKLSRKEELSIISVLSAERGGIAFR